MVEIAFHVIVYGKENHADTITHIRLADGTPASIRKAMTGVPAIFLAGHLQKITRMNGEYAGFGNLNRIEGIRQPGKHRVVGLDLNNDRIVTVFALYPFHLIPVQAKLTAQPVNDPAGLLAFGAFDVAPRPNGPQANFVWYSGIVRRCRVQSGLEVQKIVV